jgi:hypothetical protein
MFEPRPTTLSMPRGIDERWKVGSLQGAWSKWLPDGGDVDPDVLPSRVLPSFDAHGGQAEQVGGPVASPHLMPLTFGG